ncbi:MAG: 3-deoxy-8-phosphooctulonate synthase [Euryarchaeota archaeon]|nr:3-deoxy-8-phosphooctulonate synthase [Euryarchaeota archaeon]
MLPEVKQFKIGDIPVGGSQPLFLIAGLCVIESEEHTRRIAQQLKAICREAGIGLVFKASYDKANRTSLDSYRGPGLREGLRILARIKEDFKLPLLIDFHREEDASAVAQVADILQVPAFLCRQTDLLLAAGRTGRAVNVKKGQFLAPEDVLHIISKLKSTGNQRIMITERGVSFGYHSLVNDLKALPIMRDLGFPVIFDATHSTQLPGGGAGVSGGERRFVPFLARAAAAAGCDGIFMEVHDRPEEALSDAASVLPLPELPGLLRVIKKIDRLIKRDEKDKP